MLLSAMVIKLLLGVKYLSTTITGVFEHPGKVPAFQMVQHMVTVLAEMATDVAFIFALSSSTINFRVISAKLTSSQIRFVVFNLLRILIRG